MRLLHVGYGFRPLIVNGLVIYVEDLMQGQLCQGHEVGYFFGGRHLPVVRRPILRSWHRRGLRMFEWMNSSLVVGRDRGSADPDRDLADAGSEAAFDRVLTSFQPDLVHVHDLGGLPSSLLDVAQGHLIPVVMTLHDYQALCPTIKLYDASGQICHRLRPGEMCVKCCAHAPTDNRAELQRTVAYARGRVRASVPYLDAALDHPAIERASDAGILFTEHVLGLRGRNATTTPLPPLAPGHVPAAATAYDRRRGTNLERLNRLDALVLPSARTAKVWRRLGIREDRIRTIPFNPAHIERLRPKRHLVPGEPMRFAVLNGASSAEKGADLIVQTLAELSRRGMDRRFRLSVSGTVSAHVQPILAAHPSVQLAGEYHTDQLDVLLERADVGLMPSVWEEVFGFAGLEFIAKGIPVIGNALGGIPDYVRPGETGWLNRSCTATELAHLMAHAIEDPAEVQRLARGALGLRETLVRPFASQLGDLTELYEELLSGPSSGRPRADGQPIT